MDGWVNGWAHVKPLKSNKSWPNRDNSIMDILDILLDTLLKPPEPFIGLFLGWLMDGSFFWHFDSLLKPPQPVTGLFLLLESTIYRLPTKLREGNIFSCVYQSVFKSGFPNDHYLDVFKLVHLGTLLASVLPTHLGTTPYLWPPIHMKISSYPGSPKFFSWISLYRDPSQNLLESWWLAFDWRPSCFR